MKPLTNDEQLQLQLDIQHLKVEVEQLKKDIWILSDLVNAKHELLMATNNTIKAHHELLETIVDKIKDKV